MILLILVDFAFIPQIWEFFNFLEPYCFLLENRCWILDSLSPCSSCIGWLDLLLLLVFMDLLLAVCYLANTTCAIINIMTTLIFIILIVSQLHAFFLVVAVRSSLHVLVVVAVIPYFQQGCPTSIDFDAVRRQDSG